MTAKQRNILVLSIMGVIFVVLIILAVLSAHVPLNDENTVGNTPGNLNNNGYFCESDGRVYFANAYDGYSLYSMNADETDVKKLHAGSTSHINVGGNYLYYIMANAGGGSDLGSIRSSSGIYRSKLNGKSTTGLDRCRVASMQLCGNYLYYQKQDTKGVNSLEKVKINKKDQQTVNPGAWINPNCYVDGIIYYNGVEEDHYLHALNTATDSSRIVWEGNIWNPIYQNGYVYYMDIEHNYRLCRYSMYDDVVEVLTNDRIDMFNIYDNYIYYQVSSKNSPALKRMYTDGSSPELVREGVYQNINITSEYVYFNAFDEPTPVYKTSTYGAINVTTFDAGMQAALAELE